MLYYNQLVIIIANAKTCFAHYIRSAGLIFMELQSYIMPEGIDINKRKTVKTMKRVKAACITQTLHFLLKEGAGHDYALKLVQNEVKKYKEHLDRSKTQYKILSEEVQSDGSVIIEIKKQYNTSPTGHYLD